MTERVVFSASLGSRHISPEFNHDRKSEGLLLRWLRKLKKSQFRKFGWVATGCQFFFQKLNQKFHVVFLIEKEDILFKLLDECKSKNDFYFTFIYVLSVLESFVNRQLTYLRAEEVETCQKQLIQLLTDPKVAGFSRIKLSKIISLLATGQIAKNNGPVSIFFLKNSEPTDFK